MRKRFGSIRYRMRHLWKWAWTFCPWRIARKPETLNRIMRRGNWKRFIKGDQRCR